MNAQQGPHWSHFDSPAPAALESRKPHFEVAGQDEALARMHYLVDQGRRLGLLTGPSGCGKSFLFQRFAIESQRLGREVVALDLLGADGRDLLWQLASRLLARVSIQDPRFLLWRAISDRLLEHRLQGLATILLVDHVDQATDEALSVLIRVLHLDEHPDRRLTVLLAADKSHVGKLDPRLLERVDLQIEVEPWSEEEVGEFLRHRLSTLREPALKADSRTAARVWQLSQGIPRRVVRLVELLLVAGASDRSSLLGPHTVDAVHRELVPAA